MWLKANFDQISKFLFLTFWQTNSISIGFRLQTQKLESPYKTPSSTLAVKGLKQLCHSMFMISLFSFFREQGMAQWWERHSPATNVARVQIPALTPFGLSLLLVLSSAPRGFTPGSSVFAYLQKPTFPNSNSTRKGRATMWMCYLSIVIYYIVQMLEQYCSHWKQCKNNVVTLCCAKNGRRESSLM